MNFHQRKKIRTEYYIKHIYKKKLVICTACNGTGYYDTTIRGRTPKCSSCDGKGKCKEY